MSLSCRGFWRRGAIASAISCDVPLSVLYTKADTFDDGGGGGDDGGKTAADVVYDVFMNVMCMALPLASCVCKLGASSSPMDVE